MVRTKRSVEQKNQTGSFEAVSKCASSEPKSNLLDVEGLARHVAGGEKIPDKIIEEIKFPLGENVLSLRLSIKENRAYRIQVFLNEDFEIRPTTYPGLSTGTSFWKLLKGSMKKS